MQSPCDSVKNRPAIALIEDAERRGQLRPGMTVVQATGGNAGVGLAFAAPIKGYRLVLTMPESMSTERVALLRQLGAQVVLTPGFAIPRIRTSIYERPPWKYGRIPTVRWTCLCRPWAPVGRSQASENP
jgi:cysteine synthase